MTIFQQRLYINILYTFEFALENRSGSESLQRRVDKYLIATFHICLSLAWEKNGVNNYNKTILQRNDTKYAMDIIVFLLCDKTMVRCRTESWICGIQGNDHDDGDDE